MRNTAAGSPGCLYPSRRGSEVTAMAAALLFAAAVGAGTLLIRRLARRAARRLDTNRPSCYNDQQKL